jgi:hypothetical protein
MPDVYFSVPSNLIDRSNHLIFQLIASCISPNTLSVPLHHYVCNVLYLNGQKNQQDAETHILQLLYLVGLTVQCGPLPPQWPCSIRLFLVWL